MAGTASSSKANSITSTSTFVIRFWREWSAGRSQWRGRIEHVQSGESAAFLDLDKALTFIRRFDIMVEEEGAENEPKP